MDISLFDYDLPDHLIAQEPSADRSDSRLMVIDRKNETIAHRQFTDIGDFLQSGDLLVVNNTRVFKARLFGQRASGGRVEVFLLRRQNAESWRALIRPARRIHDGEELQLVSGERLTVHTSLGDGAFVISCPDATIEDLAEQHGHVPLPQYIDRPDSERDVERYQTIFARPEKSGAVAAPTAGFHFTRDLTEELRKRGISIAEVTLHVGPGTWKPITATNVADHTVDPEYAELSAATAARIREARQGGGRIVAVGTTSVRTLEAAAVGRDDSPLPFTGDVDLYIQPGHMWRWVDALVTNFHLPRSSLLVLVSSFASRELILRAYTEAVAEGYRFYSYGDASLII